MDENKHVLWNRSDTDVLMPTDTDVLMPTN